MTLQNRIAELEKALASTSHSISCSKSGLCSACFYNECQKDHSQDKCTCHLALLTPAQPETGAASKGE